MARKDKPKGVSRRNFFKKGAALGLGTAGIAAVGGAENEAAAQTRPRWDRVAEIVIAGAGASGLCAGSHGSRSGSIQSSSSKKTMTSADTRC